MRFENIYSRYFSKLKNLSLGGLTIYCKQNVSGKTSKQAFLPKQIGKIQLDGLELDEPILHYGSWVDLHGTLPKRNNGDGCKQGCQNPGG